MESTANIMNRTLHYSTKYKATINVKGLSSPQKVFTVSEPSKSVPHASTHQKGQVLSTTQNMKSFDNVVMHILKSPSTRQKVQEAVDNPID